MPRFVPSSSMRRSLDGRWSFLGRLLRAMLIALLRERDDTKTPGGQMDGILCIVHDISGLEYIVETSLLKGIHRIEVFHTKYL